MFPPLGCFTKGSENYSEVGTEDHSEAPPRSVCRGKTKVTHPLTIEQLRRETYPGINLRSFLQIHALEELPATSVPTRKVVWNRFNFEIMQLQPITASDTMGVRSTSMSRRSTTILYTIADRTFTPKRNHERCSNRGLWEKCWLLF